MAYSRKWSPSKSAARAFAQQMAEIDAFCAEHGIQQSRSSDSYYFAVNGRRYRVSNHTIEASNAHARDEFGNVLREVYHPCGREDDVTYITAGKTRIMEIYNDLSAGYKLDGRGFRVEAAR